MSDILQQLVIHAPVSKVYAALSTIPGLSGWWTTTTGGESAVGKTVEFRFGRHVVPMHVEELATDKRVAWECIQQNDEWTNTKITFDLTQENDGRTKLVFGHREWREQTPVFAHCSLKWATFLLSLREFVERGAGRPFPHDVQIS